MSGKWLESLGIKAGRGWQTAERREEQSKGYFYENWDGRSIQKPNIHVQTLLRQHKMVRCSRVSFTGSGGGMKGTYWVQFLPHWLVKRTGKKNFSCYRGEIGVSCCCSVNMVVPICPYRLQTEIGTLKRSGLFYSNRKWPMFQYGWLHKKHQFW